jgi:hypothetical protein
MTGAAVKPYRLEYTADFIDIKSLPLTRQSFNLVRDRGRGKVGAVSLSGGKS